MSYRLWKAVSNVIQSPLPPALANNGIATTRDPNAPFLNALFTRFTHQTRSITLANVTCPLHQLPPMPRATELDGWVMVVALCHLYL